MQSFYKELKKIIHDFLFFLSTKKAPRSIFSARLGYQTSRIIIFSIQESIFRAFNRKSIMPILKENKIKLSKKSEFFKAKLDLNKEYIKFLKNLLLSNENNKNLETFDYKQNSKNKIEKNKINLREAHYVSNKLHSVGGIEGNLKNHESNISQYLPLDIKDVGDLDQLFKSIGANKFLRIASFMAGYPLQFSDLLFSINKSLGSNRNEHWHSDTFHSIIKGFIYLNEVEIADSPFEYCENSADLKNVLEVHQSWLKKFYEKTVTNPESPRLTNQSQLDKTNNNKISFIGEPGTLTVANTLGLHRKGEDKSSKERWLLYFEFKRHSLLERILRIFFKN